MKLFPADDDGLRDFTQALLFICPQMIAEGCSVVLNERQFEILKAYLEHISHLGSRVHFQLEQCVDHMPGYSVSWNNQGNECQEDAVDAIMEHMIQNIGFRAGSVERPGYMIEPSEIEDHIKVVLAAVDAKHGFS